MMDGANLSAASGRHTGVSYTTKPAVDTLSSSNPPRISPIEINTSGQTFSDNAPIGTAASAVVRVAPHTESRIVMADSRTIGNVESPLVQSVVDLSTTDVDANKSLQSSAVAGASISNIDLTSLTKSSLTQNPTLSEPKIENQQKGNGGSSAHVTGGDPDTKDPMRSTDNENESGRSGSTSPTKTDRKFVAKKSTFKPVSLNKQFLKDSTATSAAVSSSNTGLQTKGGGLNSVTSLNSPRSAAASKLKLVRTGGSSQASRPAGIGSSGMGSARTEPQPVWNKNKPPPQVAQKEVTDEELEKKYGIHLASRLGSDDATSKEAKWADIDDDDDDWAPETIQWNDGMKSVIGVKIVEPLAAPKPDPAPPPKVAVTQPIASTINIPAKNVPTSNVLMMPLSKIASVPVKETKPKTLITDKSTSKPAETAPQSTVRASPWKITAVAPTVPLNPQITHPTPPLDASKELQRTVAKEVSADVYDRTWRDRKGVQNNRELFNSHTGQMEPVQDNRNRDTRPFRADIAPKTMMLQRPTGPGTSNHPEPSAAFQQHRASTRPDEHRRHRTSSNVSGGSGSIGRRQSFSRFGADPPTPDDLGFAHSRSNHSSPSEGNQVRGYHPSGPHGPPINPDNREASPAMTTTVPANNDRSSCATASVTTGLPNMLPDTPPGPYEPTEDVISMQYRVMKESRELARKRRLEEEQRQEAEKRERLQAKLSALEAKQAVVENKSKVEAGEDQKLPEKGREHSGPGPGTRRDQGLQYKPRDRGHHWANPSSDVRDYGNSQLKVILDNSQSQTHSPQSQTHILTSLPTFPSTSHNYFAPCTHSSNPYNRHENPSASVPTMQPPVKPAYCPPHLRAAYGLSQPQPSNSASVSEGPPPSTDSSTIARSGSTDASQRNRERWDRNADTSRQNISNNNMFGAVGEQNKSPSGKPSPGTSGKRDGNRRGDFSAWSLDAIMDQDRDLAAERRQIEIKIKKENPDMTPISMATNFKAVDFYADAENPGGDPVHKRPEGLIPADPHNFGINFSKFANKYGGPPSVKGGSHTASRTTTGPKQGKQTPWAVTNPQTQGASVKPSPSTATAKGPSTKPLPASTTVGGPRTEPSPPSTNEGMSTQVRVGDPEHPIAPNEDIVVTLPTKDPATKPDPFSKTLAELAQLRSSAHKQPNNTGFAVTMPLFAVSWKGIPVVNLPTLDTEETKEEISSKPDNEEFLSDIFRQEFGSTPIINLPHHTYGLSRLGPSNSDTRPRAPSPECTMVEDFIPFPVMLNPNGAIIIKVKMLPDGLPGGGVNVFYRGKGKDGGNDKPPGKAARGSRRGGGAFRARK